MFRSLVQGVQGRDERIVVFEIDQPLVVEVDVAESSQVPDEAEGEERLAGYTA